MGETSDMMERVRTPLYRACKPGEAALHYTENPADALAAKYQSVWETSMHDMPFVNNALSVAAIGFRRHEGDWVGAVVTPWSINLVVLPGGGTLWSDMGSGERVKIAFPVGTLEFISDYDPGGDIPAYQYCTLFAPVSQFTQQEAAVAAAEAALESLFSPPESVTTDDAVQDETVQAADAQSAPAPERPEDESVVPPRRAFLRRLAGRQT